jgi:hypothetical protein
MKKPIPKKYLFIVRLFIALLLGILVYLALMLVGQYRYIAREQIAHGKRMQLSNFRKHHTLGVGDVSLIESWMTFDYISTAFKVPATYLKSALGIDDPRFPRITLHKYAKIYGLDEQVLTDSVIERVSVYLMSSSTKSN